MPFEDQTLGGFTPVIPGLPDEPRERPSLSNTIGTAFALENDVVAGVELMTKPFFEVDPTFNFAEKMKEEEDLVLNYQDAFMGVRSAAQFDYKVNKIKQEEAHRDTLAQSGVPGIVSAIAAGVLSPTIFIPLVGSSSRGLKALAQGAMLGASAGAIQAATLHAAQETRSPMDALVDVGAGAVVGGILGVAVRELDARAALRIERQMVERQETLLAEIMPERGSSFESSIDPTKIGPPTVGGKKAVGAAAPEGNTTAFLKGLGGTGIPVDVVSKMFGKLSASPVVQNIQQPISSLARSVTWKLGNGGLTSQLARYGVTQAPGGTVENRALVWNGLRDTANRVHRTAWKDYKQSLTSTRDAMSNMDFKTEIARAMREGAEFAGNKFAKAAGDDIRKELFDPMTKRAQEVELLPEDLNELLGDVSYLNRVFDKTRIERNRTNAEGTGFVDRLTANNIKHLEEKFAKAVDKLKHKEELTNDLVKAMGLSPTEAKAQRILLERQREALEAEPAQLRYDRVQELGREIREARKASRELPTRTPADVNALRDAEKEIAELRGQVVALNEAGGKKFADWKVKRGKIGRGLRGINKSIGLVNDKYLAKLSRIDKLEEAQHRSLRLLNRKAAVLERNIGKFSAKVLRDKLGKLKNAFERAGRLYDERGETINRLANAPERDLTKLVKQDDYQASTFGRMNNLAERLDDTDALLADRDVLEELARDIFDEVLKKTNDLNSRRAVRMSKLEEQAKKLDPTALPQVREKLLRSIDEGRERLHETFRAMGQDEFGVENIDIEAGTANFEGLARLSADRAADEILNINNRGSMIDIVQGERGPELARTLNIASKEIEDFLLNDIEDLVNIYTRTMGADIEMKSAFGDVNGTTVRAEIGKEFDAAMDAAPDQAARDKIAKAKKTTDDNLDVMIGRIRHTRGVPDNPGGASHRLAKVAQNLNTARFMGFVANSSIPDIARPVFRYGLLNTYRRTFGAMVKGFKELKLSAGESRIAGVGNDVETHQTFRHLAEVFDDQGRQYSNNIVGQTVIKAERGLEYATAKIGLVAGFDHWNAGMKRISSVIINGEMLESIRTVVTGKPGNVPMLKAKELLARSGLDANRYQKIWALVNTSEGGGFHNGVALPNTADWTNPKVFEEVGIDLTEAQEMVRSYRAALTGEINTTIVMPGIERPAWMDSSSLSLRLLGQFKSFMFASNTRTVMAGMQQADMAAFNGMMLSLALGAFSYYTYANLSGGKALDEMEKAGLDKWADEAISRSGLLGALQLVQDVGESVPLTSGMLTFSGEQTTRRGGGGLMGTALGPTFDLMATTARIASSVDDPTVSTLHDVRKLMPYQNVLWAKRLIIDSAEEFAGEQAGLPDRRN